MRKRNIIEIKEDIPIPGTGITLEAGDRIKVVPKTEQRFVPPTKAELDKFEAAYLKSARDWNRSFDDWVYEQTEQDGWSSLWTEINGPAQDDYAMDYGDEELAELLVPIMDRVDMEVFGQTVSDEL